MNVMMTMLMVITMIVNDDHNYYGAGDGMTLMAKGVTMIASH